MSHRKLSSPTNSTAAFIVGSSPRNATQMLRLKYSVGASGQILMLGVAAEVPMLLHPLQPVGHPSAVGLDVDHLQLREFLEHAVPDEPRHRRHRLERMRQDVAADVGVHPIAERRHRRRGRFMRRDRLAELFDLRPQRQIVVVDRACEPRPGLGRM